MDIFMKIFKLDNNNFKNEILESKGVALVDLYADWCGPCKMIAPFIEEIAEERPDVKVCKVNVDETPEIAVKYGVMSIPTLIIFKDGVKVNVAVGYRNKQEILALLD